MEKVYSIKPEYLNNLRNMLAAFDDETTDRDFFRLDYMLKRIDSSFSFNEDEQDTIVDTLKSDIVDWPFYRRFYPKVRKFQNDGVYITSSPTIIYQTVDITHEDALKLTRAFFKKQGTFFLLNYEKATRDAENHFSFIKPNYNTNGEMVYLESVNESFFFIPNQRNANLLFTLVHEIEHAIDSTANPDFYKQDGIRETAAIFMEMIASDYFNELLHLNYQNILNQYALLATIKSESIEVLERHELLKLYKKIKHLKDHQVYRRLNKKWPREYLDCASKDKSLIAWYYYQIPLLISIELYKLYKVNKDKALEILIEIIMTGNDDNIFSILHKNGIVLNKHAHEYEESLILKLDLKREDLIV